MSRKMGKMIALLFLGMLLVTSPGLGGCGGDEGASVSEVKFGWLWDVTGRSALGITQMFEGMEDYLRKVSEEDPIPGTRIRLVTYDTHSDTGRVPVGYVWLKGQDVHLMSASPQDCELLRARFEVDEIPFFATATVGSLLDCEWLVSMYGPVEGEIESLMEWIMSNWENYPTKPKIGFVALSGVPFFEAQLDTVEAMCQEYPDKFDLIGVEMAPTTTTAWAGEILRLADADFIVPGLAGPPLASFVKEARQRGYDGRLIGPEESFWGTWEFIKAGVPAEDLDGILVASYSPWWDDDVAFVREFREYTEKYRSSIEAESRYLNVGPINGWAMGMMLVDAVRTAVEEVGAENVDSDAVLDGFRNMDNTVDGWGNPWCLTGDLNCFVRTVRMYEYEASEDRWIAQGNWCTPGLLES